MGESNNPERSSRLVAAMAVMTTIGFFAVVIVTLFLGKQVTENSGVLMLLGALVAQWGTVMTWTFGSSRGSWRKDSHIFNQASKGANTSKEPE